MSTITFLLTVSLTGMTGAIQYTERFDSYQECRQAQKAWWQRDKAEVPWVGECKKVGVYTQPGKWEKGI